MSARQVEVHGANTSEEAVQVFEQARPEIVLVDMEFSGDVGLDIIKHLQAVSGPGKTIFLALGSFADQLDEQRARDAGCRGCISRPIDLKTLPEQIEKYLTDTDLSGLPSRSLPTPFDDDPELQKLRQEFITEAILEAEQLINSLDAGFDWNAARIVAHRWAGSGGSVGFPEVTRLAREIEAAVRSSQSETIPRIRELFENLKRLFSEAKAELSRAPAGDAMPEPVSFSAVAQILAGKRLGLLGFQPEENMRLTQVIERYQAFGRAIASNTPPSLNLIRSFDVVVMNASLGSVIPQGNDAFLVIGPKTELMGIQAVREGKVESLVSPWNEHELVLGLYRTLQAISRRGPQPAVTNSGKRRVLVVDDDSTIRELVRKTVQHAGLECRVAADGDQAIEMARSWHPELAIVDVEMPGKNGFEVLTALRADSLTFDIPVILLTAYQGGEKVMRGRDMGANDYVVKPFVPEELMARVRKLLRKEVRRIWLGGPGSGGVLYT